MGAGHFLQQIAPHDLFGQRQHAHGLGVLAAQNPLHQFVDEPIGGKAEAFGGIGKHGAEKGDPRPVAPFVQEPAEPRRNPVRRGQAADTGRHTRTASFRLDRREQPELEKAVARLYCQKIRVAPPGVQHQPIGVAGRQRDESVLQFERAQLPKPGEVGVRRAAPALAGLGIDTAHQRSPSE